MVGLLNPFPPSRERARPPRLRRVTELARAPSQAPTLITFTHPRLPLSAQVVKVTVQFNPKELSYTKPAPWGHAKRENDSSPKLEFTHGKPYSMSLELMFDGYETQTDLRPLLDELIGFVWHHEKGHPPILTIQWGRLAPFQGVIESIEVKYTMFLEDGTPVRATCNLTVKEATPAQMRERSGNETR